MGVRGVALPSEAALLKGCSAELSKEGLAEGCSDLSSLNWDWEAMLVGEEACGLCMSLRLLCAVGWRLHTGVCIL